MFALTERRNEDEQSSQRHSNQKEAKMAYVNSTRANSLSFREFFLRPLQALQLMAQRRSVYVQTLSELRALSDRDLADLGLHRSLIRAVAKDAAYGK